MPYALIFNSIIMLKSWNTIIYSGSIVTYVLAEYGISWTTLAAVISIVD